MRDVHRIVVMDLINALEWTISTQRSTYTDATHLVDCMCLAIEEVPLL
jgi:hypothetical protein